MPENTLLGTGADIVPQWKRTGQQRVGLDKERAALHSQRKDGFP